MPTLGAPLDLAKYEARNLRAHVLGAAPSSPVTGQLYYNSGDNTLYWWDGGTWQAAKGGGSVADATTSSKGIVQLAGDLAGTAASPQIAAGVITDAEVAAANKDGAVGVASMRTLGVGAAQAMPGNRTLDAITAPAADVSLNGKKIIGLADPISATDGATKQYVDSLAQGLDPKASVKGASTANIASLSGSPGTVDAVTYITGDRMLVKNQTLPKDNGIYVVNTAGAWTRASDADTYSELVSAFVFVEQGTTNADTGWVCTADQGGTLGTTDLPWVQFSEVNVQAGAGLLRTGNTVDIVLAGGTASGLVLTADSIAIGTGLIVNPMIGAGEIDLTTKVKNQLPIANGGTSASTAPAARTALGASGYYSSATHGAGTTISVPQATHGLRASRGLIVQVQDEATGAVELPDVVVAANGDVTVTYGASVTANSKRVTVIG